MVHMHPRQRPAHIAASERPLFNAFSAAKNIDDWHIFHSLKMHQISDRVQGEADFVVLIPGEGIIVIEAKGPSDIIVDADGWRLVGLPESNLSPIEQLDIIREEITDYLKPRVGLIPTARILWLTTLTNEKMAKFNGDINVGKWEVLTLDHLEDVVTESRRVLQRYSDNPAVKSEYRAGSEFRGAIFKATLDSLAQEFKVSASKQTLAEFRSAQLDESEYGFQKVYDQVKRNPHLYFDGPAGTGKSGYLRRFALECYEEAGKNNKVLMLSWSELVTDYNSREYEAYKDMDIKDFGALMLEITGLTKDDKDKFPNFYSEYLPQLAASMVESSPYGNYDLIAIDEFQDVASRPMVLEFVRSLAKRPDFVGTKLVIAGDQRQQIMRDNNTPMVTDPWGVALALTPTIVHVGLTDNYRNSPEIGEVVEKIAGNGHLYDSYIVEGGKSSFELIEVNVATQPMQLLKAIREFQEEFEDSDIRILSPYIKESLATWVIKEKKSASIHPIAKELQGLLKDLEDGSGSIPWRTIQKFKGLESQAVIITDIMIKDEYLHDEQAKRTRVERHLEQLYVAVSRSNFRVKVLCDSHMAAELRKLGL
jgi:hypothetical protein